ncbi:MAG: 3-hydroxyacyl-CoA dehydrogenase [Alphaproteobacteria bacterium]|nr:3-hydroxyacyl-CoA dehydrogenase [Alphaproteobacteria bacterium]
MQINTVAVIGAGLMGSGIAAQIANAGHKVHLLDIPSKSRNRNALAEEAIEKMLHTEPAPFMDKNSAKLISCGNLEDHIDRIAEADWIIEAVVEKLEIKQNIYRRIEEFRKPNSIISSNTSTIQATQLLIGMSEDFQRNFLITHFFNPPRYMRLLEIVSPEKTNPEVTQTIREFVDISLGKGVVPCKDTPGFIANRIGTYWIQKATIEALNSKISVEEADAILSQPLGIPKTGIFGLMDLVGIDLMPLVGKSLYDSVPETDAFRAIFSEPKIIKDMIDDGYIGRKGKGGFYRLNKIDGKKQKEVLNLTSFEYEPAKRPRLSIIKNSKGNIRELLESSDPVSSYACNVMCNTLAYAADLVPEIANSIKDVDDAMRLGYAWKLGPFEMIDKIGADWLADWLKNNNIAVPKLIEIATENGGFYRTNEGSLEYLGTEKNWKEVERPQGVLILSDIKRNTKPIFKNSSASVWDIGDQVLCLEFHTKMNAIDNEILDALGWSLKTIPAKNYKALVIYNEGTNFSAGVNLGLAMFVINVAAWEMIAELVKHGQNTYKEMKYAPFPVVAAPSGLALGGGCEILLHADSIQAHAETYAGLVEVGVGLIPGWGGCKEMLMRATEGKGGLGGAMPAITSVFQTIGLAKVSRSGAEAKKLGFFRKSDKITMNRDRLLADAKQKALDLAINYSPPETSKIKLPGKTARIALKMAVRGLAKTRKATPHDLIVVEQLANVLTGGNTDSTQEITEDQLTVLEHEAFMSLIKEPGTHDRIEHMLQTGKPLRN